MQLVFGDSPDSNTHMLLLCRTALSQSCPVLGMHGTDAIEHTVPTIATSEEKVSNRLSLLLLSPLSTRLPPA